jgi:hypothetical protein
MKQERTHHVDHEKNNLNDKEKRKEDYSVNEKSNIAEIVEKEAELQQNTKYLQENLDGMKSVLIEEYEERLRRLEAELDLRMKVEIHEIEERKNEHINELMQNHEEAFKEMKQYFNDITRENLELIKQHKERYAELQAQTATNENLLVTIKERTLELEP